MWSRLVKGLLKLAQPGAEPAPSLSFLDASLLSPLTPTCGYLPLVSLACKLCRGRTMCFSHLHKYMDQGVSRLYCTELDLNSKSPSLITSCVTWGKFLNLSELQFSHPQGGCLHLLNSITIRILRGAQKMLINICWMN